MSGTPAEYFDTMYGLGPDPWGFTTKWYERRKAALTLAALPKPRYAAAFEPGCSIGVLTAQLATRCDDLLSADIAAAAVTAARQRLAGAPDVQHPTGAPHAQRATGAARVRVEQQRLPDDWPDGDFDLIVLSEVAYYLDDADLDLLLKRATAALRPGGDLVACHWRHPVAEHAQSGDAVHARLAALPGLHRLVRHEEKDFILEVYCSAPASVADREGLC